MRQSLSSTIGAQVSRQATCCPFRTLARAYPSSSLTACMHAWLFNRIVEQQGVIDRQREFITEQQRRLDEQARAVIVETLSEPAS